MLIPAVRQAWVEWITKICNNYDKREILHPQGLPFSYMIGNWFPLSSYRS
jgi:hypothetical protein